MSPVRLLVLFGGRSGEHEVSLRSARSILSVLDPDQYSVIQVGITHTGEWLAGPNALDAFEKGSTAHLAPVLLLPEPGQRVLYRRAASGLEAYAEFDVVFPVLHGTFGEDGSLQGLLELAGVAYVGAGVVGSAVGMDKGLFKDVMRANGIPVLASRLVTRQQTEGNLPGLVEQLENELGGYPLFTKPANLGSSVGITKVRSRSDLYEGLLDAARYDRRVLIERGLDRPREIEVSLLGNEPAEVSIPGEVVPADDFYSYDAKYLDDRSQLLIPAPLPEELTERVRSLAAQIYQAVDGAGMARIDFLLDRATGELYASEINTIPGFTRISMYPKLWEASGLPYPQLVGRLIELAIRRRAEREQTEYLYQRRGQ